MSRIDEISAAFAAGESRASITRRLRVSGATMIAALGRVTRAQPDRPRRTWTTALREPISDNPTTPWHVRNPSAADLAQGQRYT